MTSSRLPVLAMLSLAVIFPRACVADCDEENCAPEAGNAMIQMTTGREQLTEPDGTEPDEVDAGSLPGSHTAIRGEDTDADDGNNANLVQETDADDGDAVSDPGSQIRGEGRNMSLAQVRGEGNLSQRLVNDFSTDSYSYATFWKYPWTEINDLVYLQNNCGEHYSANPPYFRGIAAGVMFQTTIKIYDCWGCSCAPFFQVTGGQYGKLDSWDWYVSQYSSGRKVKSWRAIPSR